MIITRLTLYNFGVYAGLNTFVFENQKPVVLIGGMNGRGKTTFLEAVLLALYGANSFAYHESRYRTYGQYLKSFVNKYDGRVGFSYSSTFGFSYFLAVFALLLGDVLLGAEDSPKGWECKSIFKSL